jgi:hypothetical protein
MIRFETIEQQRRSVAMMSPGSVVNVVLQLEREDALEVLGYARDLRQYRHRWPEMGAAIEDDEDEAVA